MSSLELFKLNMDILHTLTTTDLTINETALYHNIDRELVESINWGRGAFNFRMLNFVYPLNLSKYYNAILLGELAEKNDIYMRIDLDMLIKLKNNNR